MRHLIDGFHQGDMTELMAKRKTSRKNANQALLNDVKQLLKSENLSEAAEMVAPGIGWAKSVLEGQTPQPPETLDETVSIALVDLLIEGSEEDIESSKDILSFLSGLAHTTLAKAARKAAHRFRTAGVDIETQTHKEQKEQIISDTQIESTLISQYDSRGQRIIWVAQSAPRGLIVHRARLSFRGGLLELKSGETTRKKYRQVEKELTQDQLVTLSIPSTIGFWFIHQGAQKVKDLGRGLPQGYLIASRSMPRGENKEHPALEINAQKEGIETLFDNQKWLLGLSPEQEIMHELATKLHEISHSKILVDNDQKRQQAEDIIRNHVRTYFEQEDRRLSYRNFFLDIAHLLNADDDNAERKELAPLYRGAADLFLDSNVTESSFAQDSVLRLFDLDRITHEHEH